MARRSAGYWLGVVVMLVRILSLIIFVMAFYFCYLWGFRPTEKREEPFSYSIIQRQDVEGADFDYRFNWKKSDMNGTRSSKGAEILYSPHKRQLAQWVAFRFRVLGQYFVNDSAPTIIAQYHAMPDKKLGERPRNPISSLVIESGELYFVFRESKEVVTPGKPGAWEFSSVTKWKLGHVKYDEWNIVVLRQVINPLLLTGDVYIKFNAMEISRQSVPIGYNDTSPPFFKFGIYCPDGSDYSEKYVDFLNVSIFNAEQGEDIDEVIPTIGN